MIHHPDCRHECSSEEPAAGAMSRRRLLTGAVAGAGLIATWGIGRAVAAADPAIGGSAGVVPGTEPNPVAPCAPPTRAIRRGF